MSSASHGGGATSSGGGGPLNFLGAATLGGFAFFLIFAAFLGLDRSNVIHEYNADKFTNWATSEGDETARTDELPIRGEKLIAGKTYTLREKTWLALPIPSDRCIAFQPSSGFAEKRIGDNYLTHSFGGTVEVKAFILKNGEKLGSYTCS